MARRFWMNQAACVVAAAVGLAGGCAKYYQVTDPSTGKVYYTTSMKEQRGGAVSLKDGRTGAEVTVQNSEVQTISKERFETSRANSGMAPTPAPVARTSPPPPVVAEPPPVAIPAAGAGAAAAAASANSAANLRSELTATQEQIDRTLSSLDELAKPGQTDLRGAYKRYSQNVDLLDRQARRARTDADAMRQARAQYFAQWQAKLAETDNPTLREAAADRRTRLRAGEERIVAAAADVKESFDPLMTDLQDVRKFLADDLSADRASILGPLATKSQASGAAVKGKIDALIAELDTIEAGPRPAGARGAAPADRPVPVPAEDAGARPAERVRQ